MEDVDFFDVCELKSVHLGCDWKVVQVWARAATSFSRRFFRGGLFTFSFLSLFSIWTRSLHDFSRSSCPIRLIVVTRTIPSRGKTIPAIRLPRPAIHSTTPSLTALARTIPLPPRQSTTTTITTNTYGVPGIRRPATLRWEERENRFLRSRQIDHRFDWLIGWFDFWILNELPNLSLKFAVFKFPSLWTSFTVIRVKLQGMGEFCSRFEW